MEKYASRKKILAATQATASSGSAHILETISERKEDLEILSQRTDLELKRRYAQYFLWILVVQLVVMNVLFLAVGLDKLRYQEFSLNLYMGGTLTEVFALVLVIIKYLFPAEKT